MIKLFIPVLSGLLGLPMTAMAGDWATYAGGNTHTGVVTGESVLTPAQVMQGLKLHWKVRLPSSSDTQALYIESVVRANGTHDELFATTKDGSVTALNATSGAIDWTILLPTFKPACSNKPTGIWGTPIIENTTLYVVDGAGQIHALDIGTGAETAGYPVQVIDIPNLNLGNYNHSGLTGVGNSIFITTSALGGCESTMISHAAVISFNIGSLQVDNTFYPSGNTAAMGGEGMWGPAGVLADPVNLTLYVATGNVLPAKAVSPNAQAILQVDLNLQLLASNQPKLLPGGDLDFGSTPTPIDVPGCPAMLSVFNKDGQLFLYDRNNIGSGPMQVLTTTVGGGSGKFIGMAAFDPSQQTLFFYNPQTSRDGSYTYGFLALKVQAVGNPAVCSLATAWNVQVGSPVQSHNTHAADPVIAGGLVWVATGAGNSIAAFDEVSGTLVWTTGTAMTGNTLTPPTVEDGQIFVQSGARLYAWGL